jgi:hypothetical protein
MSTPTLLVEFETGGLTQGAQLDDPDSAALDSAILGPVAADFDTDITQYVRGGSTNRGAQRELERIEAGTASLVLDNRDGRFTPFYAAGAYYPNILPMRQIRILATWSSTDYPVFQGFVESWPVVFPGEMDTEVTVSLVDGFTMLARAFVSGGFIEQSSGARIEAILDAVAWPEAERDIDVGIQTVPALTLENVSALEHLQQIAHAEGGRLFMGRDGKVVFREDIEVNPDLSTRRWADDGSGMSYRDIVIVCNDDLILNDVHMTRTGGTEQVAVDLDSQAEFGIRSSAETDIQLASDGAVLTRAELQITRYANPILRLESLVDNAMAHDFWDRVLIRDLTDIVLVVESRTDTEQTSSLEGISHEIGRDGSWTVTIAVAPSQIVQAGVLDDASFAQLDSTAILA